MFRTCACIFVACATVVHSKHCQQHDECHHAHDHLSHMDNDTDVLGNTGLSDGTTLPELQAALILWKMWPPCILLLGGFGNVATICVMRRIKDNNSSQHAFLIALAASDLTLLYTGALRHWVYYLFGVDLSSFHILTCKLLIWLVYSSGTASAWLLTCVTVQRTLAVRWPHKIRLMCTLKRTWAVIAAVVFSVSTLHFHWVIGLHISTESTCYYESARYADFALVDMCASSLVPALCLLVCDVLLSLTLFEATSSTSVSVSTNTARAEQHISSRKKVASRTTVMILAISLTFLVLTLPVCVYLLWEHYAGVYVDDSPETYSKRELAFAVSFLLWYSNSAVNFFLYCFTGTRFRREFLRWMHCGAQQDSSGASCGEKTGSDFKY